MKSDARQAYESLLDHLQQLARVTAIHEQLAWDELTMLPDASTEYRGQQLAYLAGLQHEIACDPRLDEWLSLVDGNGETPAEKINVAELRRRHLLSKQLPKSLVEELARVTTTAQHEWAIAREQDDFGRFGIWLDRVVALKREQARCWSADRDGYGALVAEYEPGLPFSTIQATLAELSAELPKLVQDRVAGQRPRQQPPPLTGNFDIATQRRLCEELARQLGFDFRRGRLDTAAHPFTTHISAHDCRIAIRYNEHNLAPVISVLLHELGHALYDQGLPPEHFGEPVGEPISLSVHESQARLWENPVGRCVAFWQFALPQIEDAFPAIRGLWTPEDIAADLRRVEPGINRVTADEATYNLHILVRVELEQALLRGDLKANDLPAAWNSAYERFLGVKPDNDREGCLQDGHWAAGMFGYFPTYTLGNVMMAQLAQHMPSAILLIDEFITRGDFKVIVSWLRINLFSRGKQLTTAEWAEKLCPHELHAGLNIEPLLRRLGR
ncbi:carboxypeptidase M32 [Anatilimnocola floriformis]|uniref:carboxypeptidase M32 n=1 Tax=Anatilimnocola floriformis TaxID=2948575 RepID=UPI0020C59ED7|nr:carboxypeptidase M32 [Anatilimnocola floriformis]